MKYEDPLQEPNNVTEEEFEEIINQDEQLELCGTLSESEIVLAVKQQKWM